MTRLPARRGMGAPRRRGVSLPTAANVPQVTPRSDPGVTVPEAAFSNGLALADLGAAIGDVGAAIRKEERKRAAEEALEKAAQDRNKRKPGETDEPPEKPTPPPDNEAPPESEPLSSVEDDVRAVKLRDVALNEAMNDVLIGGAGADGYLSSKGEAAMAAYGTTKQALIALAEDYLGQIGNERVRRKLEPVVAAQLQGNLAAVERHRDAQRPVANQAASQARIDNAIADATGRPDDPGAILQAQAVVYDETLQIAEGEGKNEEEARQAANDKIGQLHAGVVEALVDRDPSAAHAYLAAKRDAIAMTARADLDALVQEGLIPVVAEQVAREIHASRGTLAERREAVKSYTAERTDKRLAPEATPILRQAIAQHLERLDAEEKARIRAQVAEALDAAWDLIESGKHVLSIPVTIRSLVHRYDPESLEAMMIVADAQYRGKDIDTDPIAFRHLMREANVSPKAFVELDLRQKRGQLSLDDYTYLKDLQEQLEAGGESAARTRALLRTIMRKADAATINNDPSVAAEKFHSLVNVIRDLEYLENHLTKGTDIDAYVKNNPINNVDPNGTRNAELRSWKQLGREGEFSNGRKWPPLAPAGVDIDRNIAEAEGRWNPFWFKEQVDYGGPWDYKQRGKEYENFGNFHYGATGAAFGFPDEVLLNAAGKAQVDKSKSLPSWGKPGPILLPVLGTPPYGDDPKDQYWIKRGIDFYRNRDQWNTPVQHGP